MAESAIKENCVDVFSGIGYMVPMDMEVLKKILDAAPIGIVQARPDGSVAWANQAALDLMGISARNLEELNLEGLMDGESSHKETMVSVRGKERFHLKLERQRLKDGSSVVYISDISEIHRLQSEILRMDKLASAGELTSGIAHEIRNPLAGIKTTAQALDSELAPGDPRRAYTTRIIAEIDRLSRLLSGFFDFARPRDIKPVTCDICKVMENAVYMVRDTAAKNRVEIFEFYPGRKVSIKADPHLIQQVLMNVFINAIDAMEFGGRLEVHLVEMNERVQIAVSDTGKGIPDKVKGKVFEPFFTTKPRGVGLGLSISYRIVKQHSGDITFESGPGGTTFIITLPRDPSKAR